MNGIFAKLLPFAADERRATLFSFFYFFFLLASYYVVQPLRDELGLFIGKDELPSLFRWSLVIMLAANPLYSYIIGKYRREVFIPLIYRLFALQIAAFLLAFLFLPDESHKTIARVFFLWVGVFNLFTTSMFWSFMVDVFSGSQGKRLFGFIGAGGTLGEIAGSALCSGLAHVVPQTFYLLAISLVLLECSVQCMRRLVAHAPSPSTTGKTPASTVQAESSPRIRLFDGIRLIGRSPYLLGICLFLFFYTYTSSFLYFEKQTIVDAAIPNRADRTAFFSNINLIVSAGTLLLQFLATGAIISRLGIGKALAFLPLLTAVGFGLLGAYPELWIVAGFEVMRKMFNYALARPARELLFTVTTRAEKYASKSFIDTFIYRGGDAVASGAFEWIIRLEWGLSGVAFAAVPVAGLWWIVALFLGKAQQRRAR